jgi:peptidyl-tRNA hydrolase, PTH1 family
MKIIVGLGNPGDKYKFTRHNAGFMAVDFLVNQAGLSWQINKKFNAEFCKDGDIIYLKPLNYMNNSGQAVLTLMSFYNLLPKKLGLIREKNSDLSDVLNVIHDDIDIEFGKIKESIDSRSAGHNGVQSIINHLKTKNFRRIRIGVKTDALNQIPAEKFVLENFRKDELEIIKNLFEYIKI